MPAAAIVTLVLTAVTVLVLAAYLVFVAVTLRQVSNSLGKLVGGLETIADQTRPTGEVVEKINAELAGIQQALHGAVGEISDDRESLEQTSAVSR